MSKWVWIDSGSGPGWSVLVPDEYETGDPDQGETPAPEPLLTGPRIVPEPPADYERADGPEEGTELPQK